MKIPFTRSGADRRDQMIREHLAGRDIHDPAVLAAMKQVPREEFIDPALKDEAYDDNPLPIGEGQTISQPYIVAYMLQALELTPADKALEIGTGSGYGAAVLSRIVQTVHTVERLGELADQARRRLNRLGYDNVTVHTANGTLGYPQAAPYDAIVVTAAAPHIPPRLQEQLTIGGRLIIPVGASTFLQVLVRLRRVGEQEFIREDLCGVRFVPLIGTEGW